MIHFAAKRQGNVAQRVTRVLSKAAKRREKIAQRASARVSVFTYVTAPEGAAYLKPAAASRLALLKKQTQD